MKFFYHNLAGEKEIIFEDISHFKARRLRVFDKIFCVNFKDFKLYEYEIDEIKKSVKGRLIDFKIIDFAKEQKNSPSIALCVIDLKETIEILPFLNEIDIKKLFLIYSDFSQKNYKIDDKFLQKANRVLIYSSEQCGRYGILEIEVFNSLKSFLDKNSNAIMVDFSGENSEICGENIYVIGPEGGFSIKEKQMFKKSVNLGKDNILKAKTAVCFVASKL